MEADDSEEVVDTLKELVAVGSKRKVILEYLKDRFGIIMCRRTLYNTLKRHGIVSRKRDVSVRAVANAIAEERSGPGANAGYRFIHQALRTRHNLPVSERLVRDFLTVMEPERCFGRVRSFPWARRLIYCPGPNFFWCIDGYDKLGKFKVLVHGCIDQYSRRVMWLEANVTNRIAELVGLYYLKTVEKYGVAPEYVSSDFGGEAVRIAECQTYFHREESDPAKHHIWTYSVRNVTIESWWRQFRKLATQYWLNEFEELEAERAWAGDICDEWALLAVYMPLIRADLKRAVFDHNNHVIRQQRDRIRPGGRPNELYDLPHMFGGSNRGKAIPFDDIERAATWLGAQQSDFPVLPAAVEMRFSNWFQQRGVPVTRANAKETYKEARAMLIGMCGAADGHVD